MNKSVHSRTSFRFTSTLEQSVNRLWSCHFRVPDPIARKLTGSNSRRVVCTLNESAEYQCAMRPHGNGSLVISVNKRLLNTLGLRFGMQVRVILRRDTSEYGLPMPEELRELLRQDREGNRLFHALTRGKQRTLLYIVGSVEGEKRITRAITVINHLKSGGGKINYKRLYAALKDPRRA